jgi:heme/copper-type cytochrome/quinol oxidase subunit 3
MQRAGHLAMKFDRRGTGVWTMIAAGIGFMTLMLRWFEFDAVNTTWDANAYGSIVWLILALHGTLILADFVEGATIGSIFFTERCQSKHFSDVEDAALYRWFLALVWVPLYFLLYISPRLM